MRQRCCGWDVRLKRPKGPRESSMYPSFMQSEEGYCGAMGLLIRTKNAFEYAGVSVPMSVFAVA
jgi:hypothetical protein